MYHTNIPAFFLPSYPSGADDGPHCPICGEQAETLYIDRWGMTVGCGACVSAKHPRTPAAFPPPENAHASKAARPVKRKGENHEKRLSI